MRREWVVVLGTVLVVWLLLPLVPRTTSRIAGAVAGGPSARLTLPNVEPVLLARTQGGKSTRVIIVLKPTPNPGLAANDLRKAIDGLLASKVFRQLGKRPLIAAAADYASLQALSNASQVESVIADNAARMSASRVGKQAGADSLWANDTGRTDTSVAVLDTGIDTSHPYFSRPDVTTGSRVIKQACFSLADANHISLCPNGLAKDESANAATPSDISIATHGTLVAGVASGWNGLFDGCRIDGIARRVDIVAVQVFTISKVPSECSGQASCLLTYESSQIEALDYLRDNRAALRLAAVNMSFAEEDGPSHEIACDTDKRKEPIDDLLAAGVATVIAAGNAHDAYGVRSPGCISSAITVGAVRVNNNPTFSTGPVVDLLAPGVCVASSAPGGSYVVGMGTSLSAPFVAGAVAALRAGPSPSPVEHVRDALLAGAAKVMDCWSGDERRLLDIGGALSVLNATTPPQPGPGSSPPAGGTSGPPGPAPGSRPPTGGTTSPPVEPPGSRLPVLRNDCTQSDPKECPTTCVTDFAP